MPEFMLLFEDVLLPILGMGMGAFAMFGVYRTINRHLDRRHERLMAERAGGGDARQLDELRGRVEDLEEGSMRLQDLEERLDFAERMLAQQQRRGLNSGRTDD
jgi:hypothetical protein